MKARMSLAVLSLLLLRAIAHAGFQAIPEPGIAELLAVAATAAVAVALRNRRRNEPRSGADAASDCADFNGRLAPRTSRGRAIEPADRNRCMRAPLGDLASRRAFAVPLGRRWFNQVALWTMGSLVVRLAIPVVSFSLAVWAQREGWGL
jgi:hypothetical protein